MNKRGRTQPACTVRPLQVKAIASVAAALFEAAYAPLLFANPTGAQVVAGGVTVSTPSSSQMNITQSTPNAIVNWNTFSIATGESVHIAQPSAQAALLNRVMGNDPSTIAGSLRANGKVLLVNPAGVIFSPGSSVNVGSLVASTLGISNADFLAGNFHFVGKAPAAVTNAGTITAADGGTIALLGGTVTNSGTVAARLGTVAMGAGGDITLDFAGDGLTTIKINAGTANALLGNTGTLAADGGTVVMSAQTAQALADTVINQQGIVRAQSLAERDGHIILDGGSNGVTLVSGTLDASGGAGLKGGQVDVTGYDVALLAGANVNASGAAGGGAVRFGGGAAGADPSIRNANAVWMDPTAQIHADALTNGNGGHIVAYGTTAARLYGTLSAQGGPQGGDGGLIETSGYALDLNGATINASAPKGNGGTWLIDPFYVYIDQGGDQSGSVGAPGGSVEYGPFTAGTTITNGTIDASLNQGTSVKISTGTDSEGNLGNIVLEAPISKNSGGNATFTLSASGSITLSYLASIISTSGQLGIVLDANVGSATSGNVISISGATLYSNGGDITIGVKEGLPGTFDGASVQIDTSNLDARVQQSPSQQSGAITIHGQSTSAAAFAGRDELSAVAIYDSQLNTSTGDIEIEAGLGSGTAKPVNGVYISSVSPHESELPTDTSKLTTGSGSVRIYGVGTDSTGTADYDVSGVYVDQGTTIQTGGGSIDIRGALVGGRTVANTLIDAGLALGASTLSTAGGTISLAGSSNSASVGVVLSSLLFGVSTGTVTLDAGGGAVIVRAANNNTSGSLLTYGTLSATGGTLVLLPGGVDASTYAFTQSTSTAITLGSDVSGFGIDPLLMGVFGGFANVIVGSSEQTGAITVAACTGESCQGSAPVIATNLTLENDASGSQGIQLPYGLSVGTSGTLGLASAGTVTQGGPVTAGTLALVGAGTFTLTNANNSVATLSVNSTGNVTLTDATGVELSPAQVAIFDPGSGTFGAVAYKGDVSLTPAGNLTVTANGDIGLDYDVHDSGSNSTFSLQAAGNIYVETDGTVTFTSTGGPVNVVFDANVGPNATPGNYVVRLNGLTLDTNGGTFTIGDTGKSVVDIEDSYITTEAGAIGITGTNAAGVGVAIGYSFIGTGMGNVTVNGTSTGGIRNNGGVGVSLYDSGIQTGGGSISVTGNAEFAAGGYNGGVVVVGDYSGTAGGSAADAFSVTGSGTIGLTGTASSGNSSTATNGNAYGVWVEDATLAAQSGNITLNGTATAPGMTTGGYAVGVDVIDATIRTTSTGAIGLTGTATSTGYGYGIAISGSSLNTGGGDATMNGTLNVSAIGSSTVPAQNAYGFAIGTSSISTGGGNVSITGTASSAVSDPHVATGALLTGTTVDTTSGNVTVVGTGQSASGAVDYKNGTWIYDSKLTTTTGNVSITGNSNALGNGVLFSYSGVSSTGGSITFYGTSGIAGQGAPFSFSYGVYMVGAYPTGSVFAPGSASNPTLSTTGNGTIEITGTAAGNYARGVELDNGALTTANGAMTLNGTANVAKSGTGVRLSNMLLTANAGTVQATGTVNDAPGGTADGYGVWTVGSSILTDQGGVTLNGTTAGATTYAYGVYLDGGFAAGTTVQPTIQTGSGAISVTGNVPATQTGSVAVDLVGATVTSSGGAITLKGNTTGTPASGLSSDGVVLTSLVPGTVTTPTSVTTGSGTLTIDGSGFGTNAQGVLVAGGSTITSSNAGTIDIRGVATGPTNGGTQYDYGTLIYNGTISATAPNTTISIAGSTNTADAGLAFGAAPVPSTFTYASGPVKVNAGTNGTLALRAANDGTTSSFVNDGATITANDGTLALMPASVNPSTFNFTALDGTPITLFGTGAPGLSIDATAFSLFSGFSTFVLGSSTQTGLITVSGVCASSSSCTSLTKPSMNENLTLMNLGAGSQGIQLLYGISLGANTLTLASAGAVTDPGGIQAAGLLLDGPGTFTLNDPENNVGVLAMLNVGNVNFLNSTSFVIGPIVSHSFDAASNTAATIDATNSNLTGNLLAQAATGGIGLGGGAASAGGPTGGANTNLSAGGTIDLVMENGVFTDNGTGSVSANNGWRIWASTWVGETRGNVQPNTLQPNFYGCSFGAGCVWGGTVPLTGDHFVYVARPTVTVTANGVTRVWGAPNPNFTYTTSGLINGDTAAGALSGTLSTSANSGSLPGQYAIDPSFLSGVGYIVIEQPGTLNVVVPQPTYAPDLPLAVSGLQSFFGPSEKTFVYENNLQGTNICVGSNQPLFTTAPPGENQDLLAVEWKRVRSQPNLNSCMLLNGQHGCGDF